MSMALSLLPFLLLPAVAMAAETQGVTPGGATFMVPDSWSVRTAESSVLLQPPESGFLLAIFDTRAAGASEAVGKAWAAVRPQMKRSLRLSAAKPARNGWSAEQEFDYETSPNERAVTWATAYRAGEAWTVILADGAAATFEKRYAQIAVVCDSLRPKGYQKESFAGRKALPLNAQRVSQIRAFVESSMKTLSIPGAAFALVQNGKVVYEGGLGVRELGKTAPVDANTLFMAASNTKGMTTLLLARLVDEKKLRWDQPVTEVYPGFRVGDPETTLQIQVKHLICACTGLPRQDAEWIFEFKNATAASTFAILATVKPTSRFGEVYQYSNLMASAAGYIGAHIYYPEREMGAAYDEAMKTHIFAPLGMHSTTFDYELAQKGNHARPHSDDIYGKPATAGMEWNYSFLAHRPAGGVWTSAHDLIRYIQMELANGKTPDGKQLVSAENVLARRTPQISAGSDRTYGMGLIVENIAGVSVVRHGGSLWGFKSDIAFLPEHGVGAILLTNSDRGQALLGPFRRRLLEVLFDGKPEAAEDVQSEAKIWDAAIAKYRERLVVPADSGEVSKLAAHYKSDKLGDLTVLRDGDRTVFDAGEWRTVVGTRKNDDGTVSFFGVDPARWLEFVPGVRDSKRVLVVHAGQHEYVFVEEVRN